MRKIIFKIAPRAASRPWGGQSPLGRPVAPGAASRPWDGQSPLGWPVASGAASRPWGSQSPLGWPVAPEAASHLGGKAFLANRKNMPFTHKPSNLELACLKRERYLEEGTFQRSCVTFKKMQDKFLDKHFINWSYHGHIGLSNLF